MDETTLIEVGQVWHHNEGWKRTYKVVKITPMMVHMKVLRPRRARGKHSEVPKEVLLRWYELLEGEEAARALAE